MWRNSFNPVTGGGRGIGGAVSRILAEEGNNIIFTGRKLNSSVEEFTNNLKSFNVDIKFSELELGNPASI